MERKTLKVKAIKEHFNFKQVVGDEKSLDRLVF